MKMSKIHEFQSIMTKVCQMMEWCPYDGWCVLVDEDLQNITISRQRPAPSLPARVTQHQQLGKSGSKSASDESIPLPGTHPIQKENEILKLESGCVPPDKNTTTKNSDSKSPRVMAEKYETAVKDSFSTGVRLSLVSPDATSVLPTVSGVLSAVPSAVLAQSKALCPARRSPAPRRPPPSAPAFGAGPTKNLLNDFAGNTSVSSLSEPLEPPTPELAPELAQSAALVPDDLVRCFFPDLTSKAEDEGKKKVGASQDNAIPWVVEKPTRGIARKQVAVEDVFESKNMELFAKVATQESLTTTHPHFRIFKSLLNEVARGAACSSPTKNRLDPAAKTHFDKIFSEFWSRLPILEQMHLQEHAIKVGSQSIRIRSYTRRVMLKAFNRILNSLVSGTK